MPAAWLCACLLLALSTRGGDPLAQPTRQRVFDAIVHTPGIRFSELRAALGASTGVIDHHTRLLLRAGLIVTHKDGRHRTYSTSADAPAARSRRALAASALAIAALVESRGEIGYAEIIDAIGLSKSSVSHHAHELCARGLVDLARRDDGRVVLRRVRPNSQNAYHPRARRPVA